MTIRTRSFRAYLSAAGHRNLDDCFRQLTWLWNRALCKRRQAWDRDETSVSLYDQCKELTITREDPEWSRFAVGMQRSTLKRLDDAFGAFFRRLKAGEKPGYPCYRTVQRRVRADLQSAGGEAHGWALLVDQRERHRTHPFPRAAGRPRACGQGWCVQPGA